MNETNSNIRRSMRIYNQTQRRLKPEQSTRPPAINQRVPQYILDSRYKDIICISSDEEDEGEDINSDRGDSYYTMNDTMEIDTSSEEVIEINSDNDSDEVEFLYEAPRPFGNKFHNRVPTTSSSDDQDQQLPSYVFKRAVPTNQHDTQTLNNSAIVQCCYCGIEPYGSVKVNLTACIRKRNQNYCLGCYRFTCALKDPVEQRDAINWFVTGELPAYDQPKPLTYWEIIQKLKKKRELMCKRLVRRGGNGNALATTEEIFNLCNEKNFRCAITGHCLYVKRIDGRRPYWTLTIDHIKPVNYHGTDPTSWSQTNLQLMASILNGIKGHLSDETLVDWYTHFIAAKG